MKYFIISFVLAATAALASAAPMNKTSTDALIAQFRAQLNSTGPENGARVCQTSLKSGSVKNAEDAVDVLRSLQTKKCDTDRRVSGYWAAGYTGVGNIGFAGVVLNKKCSQVVIRCHVLGSYFQDLIDACKFDNHIAAQQYLQPDQFDFVNPKLCKKTNKDFAIGIITLNDS